MKYAITIREEIQFVAIEIGEELIIMKWMYVLKDKHGGYICKGSYVVNGETYKIIGDYKDSIKFKTYKAANNYLDKLYGKYANVGGLQIMNVKEEI